MVRAEVKHDIKKERGESRMLRPVRSAVEGLTRRTPPDGGLSSQSGAFW